MGLKVQISPEQQARMRKQASGVKMKIPTHGDHDDLTVELKIKIFQAVARYPVGPVMVALCEVMLHLLLQDRITKSMKDAALHMFGYAMEVVRKL